MPASVRAAACICFDEVCLSLLHQIDQSTLPDPIFPAFSILIASRLSKTMLTTRLHFHDAPSPPRCVPLIDAADPPPHFTPAPVLNDPACTYTARLPIVSPQLSVSVHPLPLVVHNHRSQNASAARRPSSIRYPPSSCADLPQNNVST